MFCGKCGKQLQPEDSFCTKCGAVIKKKAPHPDTEYNSPARPDPEVPYRAEYSRHQPQQSYSEQNSGFRSQPTKVYTEPISGMGRADVQAKTVRQKRSAKQRAMWIAIGAALIFLCVIAIVIPKLLKTVPTSESEIREDLQSYVPRYTDESFIFDGLTITKRQTDASNKIDTVYIEWNAHNDVCSVQNEAEMIYTLYNDGWQLEEVSSRRTGTTIFGSDVSSDSARAEVESSYIVQQYESKDISEEDRATDLISGTDTFTYSYKVYFEYCTTTYTAQVTYKFYDTKWVFDEIQWDDGVCDWDIVGEWACRTEDVQVWVNILSFEDNQGQVEYSVKFEYSGWYNKDVQSFATDEPVNVYGDTHWSTDQIRYLTIDLPAYNASTEDAEPGYLHLYPSRMYWNSLHAVDNTYVMERIDGSTSTELSDLFISEEHSCSYFPIEMTDPDGITHDGFIEYESYKSMWNHELEAYSICELDRPYTTISGTYFCDEKMPGDTTISLYIYADDVCVYSAEHLSVGDGVRTFSADISGASTLKVSAINDDELYCGTDDPRPTIIFVDTYLN